MSFRRKRDDLGTVSLTNLVGVEVDVFGVVDQGIASPKMCDMLGEPRIDPSCHELVVSLGWVGRGMRMRVS